MARRIRHRGRRVRCRQLIRPDFDLRPDRLTLRQGRHGSETAGEKHNGSD
jgi:hypothetical protein